VAYGPFFFRTVQSFTESRLAVAGLNVLQRKLGVRKDKPSRRFVFCGT
jgi:hypothetical protein